MTACWPLVLAIWLTLQGDECLESLFWPAGGYQAPLAYRDGTPMVFASEILRPEASGPMGEGK